MARRKGEWMRHTRVVVSRYGGPEVLQLVEEDVPEPKPGEVRVRMQTAGVALPDVMMREGTHPETPLLPFTPGWDLVGTVDLAGAGVTGYQQGQVVTALPIHGAYAEYVCLPAESWVPVPDGVDAAEAVSLVLNYITAYQMMHRSVGVASGRRILVHGAAGGVGTALLQLGKLAGVEMFGTCSAKSAPAVRELGCVPMDYQQQDFVAETLRLTGDGVDAVFDPIDGPHLWQSRRALRRGGRVVAYGTTTSLRGGALASSRPGKRQRFRGMSTIAWYTVWSYLLPGRRRVVPYSIQYLMRLKPAQFRQDLVTLLDLLRQQKIKPLVATRFPLAEARKAHEMLERGGVTGKIVLTGPA